MKKVDFAFLMILLVVVIIAIGFLVDYGYIEHRSYITDRFHERNLMDC